MRDISLGRCCREFTRGTQQPPVPLQFAPQPLQRLHVLRQGSVQPPQRGGGVPEEGGGRRGDTRLLAILKERQNG